MYISRSSSLINHIRKTHNITAKKIIYDSNKKLFFSSQETNFVTEFIFSKMLEESLVLEYKELFNKHIFIQN